MRKERKAKEEEKIEKERRKGGDGKVKGRKGRNEMKEKLEKRSENGRRKKWEEGGGNEERKAKKRKERQAIGEMKCEEKSKKIDKRREAEGKEGKGGDSKRDQEK